MKGKSLNIFCLQPSAVLQLLMLILVFLAAITISFAQTPAVFPSPTPTPQQSTTFIKHSSLEREFLKNIIKDQSAIWTSPFRVSRGDMRWLLPLAGGTAALIATDRKTAGALSLDQTRINASLDVSRFGSAYTTAGTALAFYAVGKLTDNQRAKETGLLAAEALINSGIVVEALKLTTQRPRPFKRDGHGNFFTGGSSFPSGHAAGIWALTTVIADEYGQQHPFIKYGAYSLAAAVSLSRYTARRHFLSDVLIGGAIGYGIGHFTYLRHRDPDLDSPGGTKKTTKLEKYFPLIVPQYDRQAKTYGAGLTWNL